MACSTPAREPPSARSTCASRLAFRGDAGRGGRAPPGRGASRRRDRPPPASAWQPLGEARASLPSWSMPSASQTTRGALVRAAPPPAPRPRAMRSGANGCGCSAAAVERARLGASILRLMLRVAFAVGTIITGRLWPSASAISRSIRKVRADHCAADAQPLSTTSTTGPEPVSALSRLGLSTGSASARMTRAAASMRISVSHQGVCAGVFSRFSMPTRMRVGGKARRRGCGGTVRSSHQMTGSASAPASSQGLRNAIGPSVMRAPSALRVFRPASDSRRPGPAGAWSAPAAARRPAGRCDAPGTTSRRGAPPPRSRRDARRASSDSRRPQRLDAIGDPALAAFRRAELHAALVGQRLLGRVEDLDQVAVDAALGQLVDALRRWRPADRGNR